MINLSPIVLLGYSIYIYGMATLMSVGAPFNIVSKHYLHMADMAVGLLAPLTVEVLCIIFLYDLDI